MDATNPAFSFEDRSDTVVDRKDDDEEETSHEIEATDLIELTEDEVGDTTVVMKNPFALFLPSVRR